MTSPNTPTTVADLIRQRRIKKGIPSQAALGDLVGVARNTANRWENADPRSKPNRENRIRLAKVLGGRPDDYLWDDDDFERMERLTEAKLKAAAYLRKLLNGELE